MYRYLRWSLAALAVLACAALAYLQGSAWLALDRERRYTAAASRLGLFDGSDGTARVVANGLEFRVRFAGFERNPAGPVIVLLHGFPTTSAMWLPLFEPLVAQGFRVVAPDQRGYSPGARPTAVAQYRTELLVEDVMALADTLGVERFHLAGHDWGAVVGWYLVAAAPGRIETWTALSIPHPRAFQRTVASDPEQARRSRYMRWLRLPWLPEVLMARDGFAALRQFTDTLPAATAAEYLSMLAEPGAARATVNWYRARDVDALPGDVGVPTLFIWGVNDSIATRASVQAQAPMVARYRELQLDAGHRLLVDSPNEVAAALLEHLRTFAY